MSEAEGIHDPSYRKGQHDTLAWLREKLGEPNLPTLTACGKRIAALRARLAEVEAERDRLREELADELEETFYDGSDLHEDGWYVTNARQSAVAAGDRLVELGRLEKHPEKGCGRVQWYRPKPADTAPAAVDQDGAREGQE